MRDNDGLQGFVARERLVANARYGVGDGDGLQGMATPKRAVLLGCMFQTTVIQKLTQPVFILNILQEVYYKLNTLNHTLLIH